MHGGYVKRLEAVARGVSDGKAKLTVLLCQLVKLYRNGEPVKMSKRSGDFVTLRDVVEEVGRDSVRFMMLYRKNSEPLDFDFAKVTEQSKDNPVFYVQYAHVVFAAIDPDNPATTSRKVIDGIIREHIGFNGLLLSDDSSMNALSGTIGERAANIIAGGCDIVLHCNGNMDEMLDVVANVPPLAGISLARAKAVEAGFAAPDTSDEAELRAEFEAMFATV